MTKFTGQQLANLEGHVFAGLIRKQSDPTRPLFIYTYSTVCELNEAWDEYTRESRGLVLDDKGRVVIPCIPKFFNSGTKFAEAISLDDSRTKITEKNDGYLIQVKKDSEYGLVVTSKGSFTSPMVEKAKELIVEDQLEEGILYVCELCCNFPGDEAIIVTRWKGDPKLVCFSKRDEDGKEMPLEDIPACFEKVKQMNFQEATEYLKRNDIEGVVAEQDGRRVKFKTEHFLMMHRLISDVRKIRVWELLSNGQDLEDIQVPDEFMNLMKQWRSEMLDQIAKWNSVLHQYEKQTESWTDKDLALDQEIPQFYKVMLFNRRKNKPYMVYMWKKIREQIKEENG